MQLDTEGSILEADGKAVARVVPVNGNGGYDRERLKQAILNRRDESRALNEAWEHAIFCPNCPNTGGILEDPARR